MFPSQWELNAGYISGMFTKDNNVYILTNRSLGANFNALLVSYNYIDGYTNWTKIFDNKWGKTIIKSYAENTNSIAVATHDIVEVLDMANSNTIGSFNCTSEIIEMYSFLDKDVYLVFLKNGEVNYINMEYNNSVEYAGRYEFNIDKYIKVALSEKGFILIPSDENRVILYEAKSNKNIKAENIENDFSIDDSVSYTDYDKLKDTYHMKNKSLVDKLFYSTDKKLLFVNYTNKDIAIYNTKDKNLIKKLTNVGKVNKYYGIDKYNRTYIGDLSDSYVLDKNFNKVAHIKNLRKVDKDKVFISNNGKIYSIKIYTLNDLLKESKEYLKR